MIFPDRPSDRTVQNVSPPRSEKKKKKKKTYLTIWIRTRTPDAPAAPHQQRMVPPTRSMHDPRALARARQVVPCANPPRRVLRHRVDARTVARRHPQARSAVPPKEPRLALCVDAHKVAPAARRVDRGRPDVEQRAEEVRFEEVRGLGSV